MDRREPPWGRLFEVLRREAGERSNVEVALLIGLIPADADLRTRERAGKDVSRWTSPGRVWSRPAPAWAVRALATALGRALVVLGDEVAIVDATIARRVLTEAG